MTIYRLYSQNGHRAGFWVQHRSWSNMCAQVESVAGHAQGALPGTAPLHDNAAVSMRMFDVRSGRPIVAGQADHRPGDKNYSQIAQPSWYDPFKHGAMPPAHEPEEDSALA